MYYSISHDYDWQTVHAVTMMTGGTKTSQLYETFKEKVPPNMLTKGSRDTQQLTKKRVYTVRSIKTYLDPVYKCTGSQ